MVLSGTLIRLVSITQTGDLPTGKPANRVSSRVSPFVQGSYRGWQRPALRLLPPPTIPLVRFNLTRLRGASVHYSAQAIAYALVVRFPGLGGPVSVRGLGIIRHPGTGPPTT